MSSTSSYTIDKTNNKNNNGNSNGSGKPKGNNSNSNNSNNSNNTKRNGGAASGASSSYNGGRDLSFPLELDQQSVKLAQRATSNQASYVSNSRTLAPYDYRSPSSNKFDNSSVVAVVATIERSSGQQQLAQPTTTTTYDYDHQNSTNRVADLGLDNISAPDNSDDIDSHFRPPKLPSSDTTHKCQEHGLLDVVSPAAAANACNVSCKNYQSQQIVEGEEANEASHGSSNVVQGCKSVRDSLDLRTHKNQILTDQEEQFKSENKDKLLDSTSTTLTATTPVARIRKQEDGKSDHEDLACCRDMCRCRNKIQLGESKAAEEEQNNDAEPNNCEGSIGNNFSSPFIAEKISTNLNGDALQSTGATKTSRNNESNNIINASNYNNSKQKTKSSSCSAAAAVATILTEQSSLVNPICQQSVKGFSIPQPAIEEEEDTNNDNQAGRATMLTATANSANNTKLCNLANASSKSLQQLRSLAGSNNKQAVENVAVSSQKPSHDRNCSKLNSSQRVVDGEVNSQHEIGGASDWRDQKLRHRDASKRDLAEYQEIGQPNIGSSKTKSKKSPSNYNDCDKMTNSGPLSGSKYWLQQQQQQQHNLSKNSRKEREEVEVGGEDVDDEEEEEDKSSAGSRIGPAFDSKPPLTQKLNNYDDYDNSLMTDRRLTKMRCDTSLDDSCLVDGVKTTSRMAATPDLVSPCGCSQEIALMGKNLSSPIMRSNGSGNIKPLDSPLDSLAGDPFIESKISSSNQVTGQHNASRYWNYGQLVTSITEQQQLEQQQSCNVLATNQQQTNSTSEPNAQSLAYFGFRRPPKRLVYFYDINDDVDEEVEFLSKSLETKSYATSMVGQHDHYLNNIAKNQAAAAKAKAATKLQAQRRISSHKASEQQHGFQIKASALDGQVTNSPTGGDGFVGMNQSIHQQQQQAIVVGGRGRGSGSSDKLGYLSHQTNNETTTTNNNFSGLKRFSQVSTSKTKDSSSAMSSEQQQQQQRANTTQYQNVELVLTPHWSSLPSHLNSSSITMMRFYQSSYMNNFYKGKRERAILSERGHFDKSSCRVDYEAYTKALDAFIPRDGMPIDAAIKFALPTRQQRNVSQQWQQQQQLLVNHHRNSMSQPLKQQEKQRKASDEINLGVIYEPFRLFPSIASNALEGSSTTTKKGSSQLKYQPSDGLNVFRGGPNNNNDFGSEDEDEGAAFVTNYWQRELLISLEKYANAIARYEERQAMRKRVVQDGVIYNNQLNRTTSAIRRGSFVVLSKLKLLQHNNAASNTAASGSTSNNQQNNEHDTANKHHYNNDNGQQGNNVYKSVPRLSLTKADSLVNSIGSQEINRSLTDQFNIASNNGGLNKTQFDTANVTVDVDKASSFRSIELTSGANVSDSVAIPMSSNESLASQVKSQDLLASPTKLLDGSVSSGGEACDDSFDLEPFNPLQMSHLQHRPHHLRGPVSIYSRHSIANLPLGSQAELPGQTYMNDGTNQTNLQSRNSTNINNNLIDPMTRLASHTPNLINKRSLPRPSLINWFQNPNKNQPGGDDSNRTSCVSQTSKATSALTEKCSQLLQPNLRRRRSFSGPLEWLQHEEHKPPYDLMIIPVKKQGSKKRLRKIKPQKSNSSDYHSMNNRRVYKLDARGFQTKLKGVFYVINHDPLVLNAQPQTNLNSKNQNLPPLSNLDNLALDVYQQQQLQLQENKEKELLSSNESSFFNTSNDENSLGNRSDSRDTTGRSTTSRNQQKRTFLRYFRWSQWMIQRRHYSLFIFSPQSRVRRFCLAVTKRREFDYFVLFFISMNCVTLAMERPKIPPYSKEREFLTIANYYFTFIFTLEMALKVIAKGLYYGKDAYLTDSWNIMDGALVGFSLFDLLLSIVADRSPRIFAILRVFRLLRSLRPLRVINRLMGLKLVVQTLLLSLRPIGNIVLICCTFFIIFGILGVQLFKGTFYYCDGPDPLEIMRTVRTKEDCLVDHRNRWVNRKYNFDNLGQALMALFVLSSKDGWVNIMYTGLDAVGVDMQPRENYNEWRLLYFISFLLLVAFFVLNMFVGVVVENFHRCRKEQELEEKARRAEKRQRKLDKRRRKLREPPYYSNYGKFRLLLHKWVTGGYFDLLIAAVIGFNVVFMSLEHYQMPAELIHLLKVSNYAFTAAFILEAAIKSSALGMRRYLKDRWNQLDVMIVVMSIIGIIFEEMDSFTLPINPTLLRVLRVMRIARVLKLLKMAKGIRALLDTVMQALPQVGNLGLLFFLLFFIFAALGVELFGRLECNEDYPCSGLMDQHAHFQNFGLAFLTLFRVATGDNWNGIMKDTLRDKCDPSSNCLKNCCISQLIAPLYFVVFVLLAQYVLVNVVVAVLMKHLEESHHEMEIDEEYELDKQLAEELEAKKRALLEARGRQDIYWI